MDAHPRILQQVPAVISDYAAATHQPSHPISREHLTLKAFANSSPGLPSGNPGAIIKLTEEATLKGLRHRPRNHKPVATPSELRPREAPFSPQGFKANSGLKLSNAFSVISFNLPNAFGVIFLDKPTLSAYSLRNHFKLCCLVL